MGFLSESARRGFKRAGGGAYVPDWYKSTVAVGGVVIVGALAYAALTSDRPDMSIPPAGSQVVVGSTTSGGSQSSSGTVELPVVGGDTSNVPRAALAAAEAAALAIWTGDWSEVPVDGDLGDTSATFPDAVVGKPSVLSVSTGSISFLFSLDEKGDGRWDQDFQVTVIEGAGGWTYPTYIG